MFIDLHTASLVEFT